MWEGAVLGQRDRVKGVTWGISALPVAQTQAQPTAAAGILLTLPVGTANPCTEKRGGPTRAEGAPRAAAATAAAGAWRAGGGLGRGANMAHNRDGGNPFAEPGELDNPFQVTCAGLLWATGLTLLGPG